MRFQQNGKHGGPAWDGGAGVDLARGEAGEAGAAGPADGGAGEQGSERGGGQGAHGALSIEFSSAPLPSCNVGTSGRFRTKTHGTDRVA